MVDATPSRLGQANTSGDAQALFLEVYGGEVIVAFERTIVTMDKHMVRTIQSGDSAQFPVIGQQTASYHTPGAEITGAAIPHNERNIAIDDLLIAPVFIANIDEAMNHYDVRSQYSAEGGIALATQWDQNVLQLGVLAARAGAIVTGRSGGTTQTQAGYANTAATLAGGLFDAMQALDENDVPEGERYFYCRPAQYRLLSASTDQINKDWGGMGAYSEGEVLRVAGQAIVKTNNLPSTNITTGPTAYQGNFSNVVGLTMTKQTVGTVMLIGLATEMGYDMRRQGTLIVAKYAIGHDYLRPDTAVEFLTA